MLAREGLITEFRQCAGLVEPPGLGPERRAGAWGAEEVHRGVREFAGSHRLGAIEPPLRSAALLWHDHLDESHSISQGIETPTGSWLHGMMHRREPDYWNSKYWFRRVGRHAAFPQLAERARAVLSGDKSGVGALLVENGAWQPLTFVDECERALKEKAGARVSFLVSIQAIELEVLIEHILQHGE